ncbi:cytochrome P450-12 [Coleophoma cylindrospora]|uniref:Cytochrome P450-12 n=1 Tax=Coleophoma cylindrospora TaxID=1849047 RepID=A0A3D8RTU7_9HELO|nr:cytochrome P450-12 [Coleophoma cylindrospora]
MGTSPAVVAALIGSVFGVTSHLGYFIHGEHHMQSGRILLSFLFGPILIFIGILRLDGSSSTAIAAKLTTITSASYLTALSLSILTYRIFFHPLRNFPGPFSAKLSKLTHVLRVAKHSDSFRRADELHKKYGEIVRVGPNELSIIIPEAVPAIGGSGSKCTKSAWYDVAGLPHKSLHLCRDRAAHDKRRKVWDRGFSAKGKTGFVQDGVDVEKSSAKLPQALRDYEGRVTKYADDLTKQLTTFAGKPFDASLWFNFYSFDVMGDLAFGRSFDMLKNGEQHHALKTLQEAMAPLGILSPLPWIFPVVHYIPGARDGIKGFIDFCDQQIEKRKEKEPEVPDIMSWLIDAEKSSNDPIHKDPDWLHGDARLVVVAGSDTTASTLTYICYYLARSPEIVTRIRNELKPIHQAGSPTESKDIQDAKYLNGVINEALRLHPPVPSGLLRQTPSEGITIGSTFIPGDVTISAPTWTMGRLESCYQHAEEFIPERWGDRPELVHDKAGFAPFSAGPYSCIGKQLALMELRVVVARIITQFDVSFAPGEDGTNLMTKTRDVFTLDVAPLMMIFMKRS